MDIILNRHRAVNGEAILQGDIGVCSECAANIKRNILQSRFTARGLHLPLQNRPCKRAVVQIDSPLLTIQNAVSTDVCPCQSDGPAPPCDNSASIFNGVAVQRQITSLRGDSALVGKVGIDVAS